MERETGIEPATSSLGSWRSTAELLPLVHLNEEITTEKKPLATRRSLELFFRPAGAWHFLTPIPRLAPWAALLRRFALNYNQSLPKAPAVARRLFSKPIR
jgi:hypothetical protein